MGAVSPSSTQLRPGPASWVLSEDGREREAWAHPRWQLSPNQGRQECEPAGAELTAVMLGSNFKLAAPPQGAPVPRGASREPLPGRQQDAGQGQAMWT